MVNLKSMIRYQLVKSINDRDLTKMENLLKKLQKKDSIVDMALINASVSGDLQLIKFFNDLMGGNLSKIKPMSKYKNQDLKKSINIAIISNHLPVVKYLIELNNTVHARNEYRFLSSAALSGNLPIMKYLIDLPHVGFLDKSGEDSFFAASFAAAFNYAIYYNRLSIVEFLADYCKNSGCSLSNIIMLGGSYSSVEHLSMAKLFIEIGKKYKIPDVEKMLLTEAILKSRTLPIIMYLAPYMDYKRSLINALTHATPDIIAFILGIKAYDADRLKNLPLPDYPEALALLAAENIIPNEDDKISKKSIKEAKKLIHDVLTKYLIQDVLKICVTFRDLPLLQLVEILDQLVEHAENIPYHIKANMLEDCKHYNEMNRKQKRFFK